MITFSDKVKDVVKLIPKGKTLSYKDVATIVGSPNGARAVARVMSQNFDTNVPCHRVIRSNGELSGYNRGGTKQKRLLLENEGYK